MSLPEPIRRVRRGRLLALIGVIAVCAIWLAGRAVVSSPAIERHERTGTPVFANADSLAEHVARIEVQLADESYTLLRTEEGWRMDSVDGYPIRDDRIGAFLAGISELSWAEPRTRDPRKLDRLGLGDPDAGGNGAQIALLGPADDTLGAVIAGRRDDTLYLRRPDEALAFRADGELPPLLSRASWLDFEVVSVLPEAIRGVVLRSPGGEELTLLRDAGAGGDAFRLGPRHSGERLVSRLAASTPALALARFAPVGVKPAEDLQTRPVARHVTLTKDGLEVIAEAYDEPDGYYLTLRAIEAAEGARRASDINARAQGWAFRLTRFDWQDFATPISDIVERPIIEAP